MKCTHGHTIPHTSSSYCLYSYGIHILCERENNRSKMKWITQIQRKKICQRNTVHVWFFFSTDVAVDVLLLLLHRIHLTDASEYCWTSILTVNWIQFTQVIALANGKLYWRVSFISRWIFEITKKEEEEELNEKWIKCR